MDTITLWKQYQSPYYIVLFKLNTIIGGIIGLVTSPYYIVLFKLSDRFLRYFRRGQVTILHSSL